MRKRTGWLLVSLTALTFVAGAVVTQTAQASVEPLTDAQLVSPAVTNAGGSYFNQAQIDQVWTAVTAHFPKALPTGYSFPKQLDFFHPTDATNPLFETGLPDMLAAQYWRCAWVDARINSPASVSAKTLTSALSDYWSLPSVASHDSTSRLDSDVLNTFATDNKLPDSAHALFALDCQGFEK